MPSKTSEIPVRKHKKRDPKVPLIGGADRDRTDDLLNAIQALSQLSYSPFHAKRETGGPSNTLWSLLQEVR